MSKSIQWFIRRPKPEPAPTYEELVGLLARRTAERDDLRERLNAMQSQKPIAYRLTVNLGNGRTHFDYVESMQGAYLDNCLEYIPLYSEPLEKKQ